MKTVRFHAGTADTRTAFAEPENGVYQTLWTGNDSEILLSLNYEKAEGSAVTAAADGRTASFEAAFDASSAASPYTFYAVSPASAARAISPSRKAWSVYIAADQKPSALSVDEAAQLLVAKSVAYTTLPDDVDLHFAHLTAYGRISLQDLALDGASVRKVELVFSTPVVGEWYWGEDGTLTAKGDSHTITLDTDASGDLWFACAPVDVSGATMTLTVFTDRGELAKEITFPEGRKFNSGKVARFSVDMAGIGFRTQAAFFPVTDSGILQPGDQILIVNAGGTCALGEQVTRPRKYRREAPIELTDGDILDPGDATVLTLGEGSSPGSWSFYTGSGYLSTSSGGNVLTESAEIDDFSSWKIAVSGSVTLVFPQGSPSLVLSYSASGSGFNCVRNTSVEETVILYRWDSGVIPPAEENPLTAQGEYGCYLAGLERTYVKGSDQILRSYGADGKLVFVLLNAAGKEQLSISGYDPSLVKGDRVTVTASWRKGLQYFMEERTFSLRVLKEDGSKVWLGDDSGQGFILKK